jgi:small subunit ribosomal protein S9
MMNKARGQRVGEARVREVDEQGRSFATGHKKSAIARVCLSPGEGLMYVNGRPIDLYFPYYRRYQLLLPFELTGTTLSFNMSAKVHGGGLAGQLDALKYGIARALQKQDPAAYREVLKAGTH